MQAKRAQLTECLARLTLKREPTKTEGYKSDFDHMAGVTNELETVRRERATLQECLAEVNASIQLEQAAGTALSERLARVMIELESVRRERTALEQQYVEVLTEVQSERTEKNALSQSLAQVNEELEHVRAVCAKYAEHLAKLKVEVETLKNERATLAEVVTRGEARSADF